MTDSTSSSREGTITTTTTTTTITIDGKNYLIDHVKIERSSPLNTFDDDDDATLVHQKVDEVFQEEEEKEEDTCMMSDTDTDTSTSSIEEGFSIDWQSLDVVHLLTTHYSYLFTDNTGSENHHSFKIVCKEPKRGMENHSITISLSNKTSSIKEEETGTTQTKFFMLRTYADPMKTHEYIAFELDTLYKLRQNLYLPVPCIIETDKFMDSRMDIRECIVPFKDHLAVMFEYCEGYHMKSRQRNAHYIQSVAEFTGHLHRCTLQHENFDPLLLPQDGETMTTPPPFLLIDERFQLHVGRVQPERLTFEYHWEMMNDIFTSHGYSGGDNQEQKQQNLDDTQQQQQQQQQDLLDDKGREMLHNMYHLCHRNLKRYTDEEQNRLERRLPRSLNHGDAHTSNVLFKLNNGDQQQQQQQPVISAVVDWDDSFIGPCIIDFVNCLFFWCIKPCGDEDDNRCCHSDEDDGNEEEKTACPDSTTRRPLKNPIKHEFVTAYITGYTRARGFGLTELEKQYFFDYLYLTMFSQVCFIMAQQDVLVPWSDDNCGEESMISYEDYMAARSMLSFILYTAALFEDTQIRSMFTSDGG